MPPDRYEHSIQRMVSNDTLLSTEKSMPLSFVPLKSYSMQRCVAVQSTFGAWIRYNLKSPGTHKLSLNICFSDPEIFTTKLEQEESSEVSLIIIVVNIDNPLSSRPKCGTGCKH